MSDDKDDGKKDNILKLVINKPLTPEQIAAKEAAEWAAFQNDASTAAKIRWEIYIRHIKVGFSPAQALQICLKQ